MEPAELDDWQRLAPLALIFIIIGGLQKFVRENLYLFLGAGAGFAFIERLGLRELLLGGLGVLLIIVISAIIYHRRFRFRLEADAVRVRRGLFERKELRVRFARVQNVQLGQPFYFRPFDLVRFSLETPGAAQKEVELPGIPRAVAERMRDCIVGQIRDSEPADSAVRTEAIESADRHLFSASTERLFVHGMGSNQVWLIFSAVAWLFGVAFQRMSERLERVETFQWISDTLGSGLLVIALAIPLVFLVLVLVSGLLSVVRFHGYRLTEQGDRLVGAGGLLDRREQTVRHGKITGLTLRQTGIGRTLGSWYLLVRQARSGDLEDQGTRAGFQVPGLRKQDHGLVSEVVSGWRVPDRFEPVSRRFRIVFWLRWLIAVAAAVGVAGTSIIGFERLLIVGAAGGAMLLLLLVHLRWRHWGWHLDHKTLWVRHGLFGQNLDAFDLNLVQQAAITQSPYQHRHDLATLHLVLPQGSVSVPFLELDTAATLANRALLAAETASVHRV